MEHEIITEAAYFESIAMGGQYAIERLEAERRRQQREAAEQARRLQLANTLGPVVTARENFYLARSGQ